MIIETPYKAGDIVSFKMSSGEEIIARLDAEETAVYKLSKPMVLIVQQQGMGLAPFMFSVSPDSKFMLNKHAVSCVSKTESEIAKQYQSQTSGILL